MIDQANQLALCLLVLRLIASIKAARSPTDRWGKDGLHLAMLLISVKVSSFQDLALKGPRISDGALPRGHFRSWAPLEGHHLTINAALNPRSIIQK